jgi:hypothetical protein
LAFPFAETKESHVSWTLGGRRYETLGNGGTIISREKISDKRTAYSRAISFNINAT